jgi:hypothetical protein
MGEDRQTAGKCVSEYVIETTGAFRVFPTTLLRGATNREKT